MEREGRIGTAWTVVPDGYAQRDGIEYMAVSLYSPRGGFPKV